MKNPNHKTHVTAADAKRALHAMLAQDGLRFPDTAEDIEEIEAAVDETRASTPDVNKFLRFVRNPDAALCPPAAAIVPFPQPAQACNPTPFGQFLRLLRRKKGETTEELACTADVDLAELLRIESDSGYEPELSTVHALATHFGLPVKPLMKAAQLATDRLTSQPDLQVRFAASANITAPLSGDEEAILQTYLKAVLDQAKRR